MALGRTKRIKCRNHGGIFGIVTSRGRQPVSCKPEFQCDKADNPPEMPAEAPKFDKPPTRFQGPCPECGGTGGHRGTCSHSGLKPANPSLTLAKGAKARLEALGWVVKGRAKVDGDRHGAEITCSRDTETLIMRWVNGELVTQEYLMEPLVDNHMGAERAPNPKLHFDPAALTDSELVKTIRGMPVRWWNSIAGSEERAVIGNKVTIEHIFRENGDEDESKRIVKFIDHNGGGFRAFHVSALLKVG